MLDFKEIALPIDRVAFVLECHQIINSNFICFSSDNTVQLLYQVTRDIKIIL